MVHCHGVVLKKQMLKKDNRKHDMLPYSKIYTINGKIAVDFIGRFENLERDVSKIQKILKLPKKKFLLNHFKKNSIKDKLKYYNEENKKRKIRTRV